VFVLSSFNSLTSRNGVTLFLSIKITDLTTSFVLCNQPPFFILFSLSTGKTIVVARAVHAAVLLKVQKYDDNKERRQRV
jgi:hypothetical protein